ncbi:hypothetical protein Misp01_64470 [Microtetraspora sp. NBRC 13810]|nr:hypothetical protein Misp01_64470 [Microtetraspora sp. NBRC 13810]
MSTTPPAEATPPPFDPELAAALAVMAESRPPTLTPDMLPRIRELGVSLPSVTDDMLRRGGAFEVVERTVPGPAGGPDVSPYAAPARAADLSGLPPAFIDVGSAETFRDESVAYASRIWLAGGSA